MPYNIYVTHRKDADTITQVLKLLDNPKLDIIQEKKL